MYKGNNPSAIRSQKWLTQSLLQLMDSKPYRKISVKEITELSDLSRQTFYQLFKTKEEILEYHLDQLFQSYLQEIMNLEVRSTAELAKLYFIFFEQNEQFIRQLIENDLVLILHRKFIVYLEDIHRVLQRNPSHMMNDYASAFISSGLIGILVHWFNEKHSLTIDQLASLISRLINDVDWSGST
ncbi:TetR family transcriptional regulator [Paenibacillus silvae]|uniref:TetR family transcriptional regulator n=1 Tax=Paenibacillus silvae TaxID=1325358 RepID=A0ABQ1ZMT0_9BACL|nr:MULTISPECIES: TetR/AcrR family transcriptional regulator [Paenibacillus]GGH69236.1 TetR family transcriptional regulator [Paenibacillus silvae]